MSELRKSSANLSSPLHHHISLVDMIQDFEKWKESTTTSLSTRHLRHYKSFLVSDGKDNDTTHCSFNNQMLQTFNGVTIVFVVLFVIHSVVQWCGSRGGG